MELIIGGVGQGKLDFAKNLYPKAVLWENNEIEDASAVILRDRLQEEIRSALEKGQSTEAVIDELLAFAKDYPNCVFLCDEVGNGIVPTDDFERYYREECGRVLIALAAQAKHVTRVMCGLGQRIK